MTEKAYQRRLRNRGAANLVDAKDLPVYAAYLQGIKSDVVKVRHKSRWLNAVSVELKRSALSNLSALDYVKKIDLLRKFRNERSIEEQPIPEKLKENRQGLYKGKTSGTKNAVRSVQSHHDGDLSPLCQKSGGGRRHSTEKSQGRVRRAVQFNSGSRQAPTGCREGDENRGNPRAWNEEEAPGHRQAGCLGATSSV